MHVYEIAKIKQQQDDLRDVSLEKVCKQIMGTCKSLGIDVFGYDATMNKRRQNGLETPGTDG